jgi:hypothetical protein
MMLKMSQFCCAKRAGKGKSAEYAWAGETYDANMQSSKFILLFAIICWVNQATNAQTPNLAFRYYELGHEKIKLGDWQGAADDGACDYRFHERTQARSTHGGSLCKPWIGVDGVGPGSRSTNRFAEESRVEAGVEKGSGSTD